MLKLATTFPKETLRQLQRPGELRITSTTRNASEISTVPVEELLLSVSFTNYDVVATVGIAASGVSLSIRVVAVVIARSHQEVRR